MTIAAPSLAVRTFGLRMSNASAIGSRACFASAIRRDSPRRSRLRCRRPAASISRGLMPSSTMPASTGFAVETSARAVRRSVGARPARPRRRAGRTHRAVRYALGGSPSATFARAPSARGATRISMLGVDDEHERSEERLLHELGRLARHRSQPTVTRADRDAESDELRLRCRRGGGGGGCEVGGGSVGGGGSVVGGGAVVCAGTTVSGPLEDAMANADAKPSSAKAASRPAPTSEQAPFHGSSVETNMRWIVHDDASTPASSSTSPVERVVDRPGDDGNAASMRRLHRRSVTSEWCSTSARRPRAREEHAGDRSARQAATTRRARRAISGPEPPTLGDAEHDRAETCSRSQPRLERAESPERVRKWNELTKLRSTSSNRRSADDDLLGGLRRS